MCHPKVGHPLKNLLPLFSSKRFFVSFLHEPVCVIIKHIIREINLKIKDTTFMLSMKNLYFFCFIGLTLSSCKINSPTRSLESEFERAFFIKENEIATLFDEEKEKTKNSIRDHTNKEITKITAQRRELLNNAKTAVTEKKNTINDLQLRIQESTLKLNDNHPPLTHDEITSLNSQIKENEALKGKAEAEKNEADQRVTDLENRTANGGAPYYPDDFDDPSFSRLKNIWQGYKEGTLKQRGELFARYYSKENNYKPVIQLRTRNLNKKLTSIFSFPVIKTQKTTSSGTIERMEFVFFYLGSPTNEEISKAKDYLQLEIYQKTNKEQDWYKFLGFDNNSQPHRGAAVKDEEIKNLIAEQEKKSERKIIELDDFKKTNSKVIEEIRDQLKFKGNRSPEPLVDDFFEKIPVH